MLSRLSKILILLIVIALSLYLVILNTEIISISFAPGQAITGAKGVILIATFCLGAIFAGAFGLILGIRTYFRERGFQAREQRRLDFYQGMLKARGYLASGEWYKAQTAWETIIKKDPTNVIARVELSRAFEGSGDLAGALRILDAARAADPTNMEVLFRAAELNLHQHNKTAAIDNLAIILSHNPCKRAAEMARDLSADLGKFEDALEYNSQAQSMSREVSHYEKVACQLSLQQILNGESNEFNSRLSELQNLHKRFPNDSGPALALANLHAADKRIDEAASYYTKAAKISGLASDWIQLVKFWQINSSPERALATIRRAVKETETEQRDILRPYLVQVYISLRMFEEALLEIEEIQKAAKQQSSTLTQQAEHELVVLKGLAQLQVGKQKEALSTWENLIASEVIGNDLVPNKPDTEGPVARLSTP